MSTNTKICGFGTIVDREVILEKGVSKLRPKNLMLKDVSRDQIEVQSGSMRAYKSGAIHGMIIKERAVFRVKDGRIYKWEKGSLKKVRERKKKNAKAPVLSMA